MILSEVSSRLVSLPVSTCNYYYFTHYFGINNHCLSRFLLFPQEYPGAYYFLFSKSIPSSFNWSSSASGSTSMRRPAETTPTNFLKNSLSGESCFPQVFHCTRKASLMFPSPSSNSGRTNRPRSLQNANSSTVFKVKGSNSLERDVFSSHVFSFSLSELGKSHCFFSNRENRYNNVVLFFEPELNQCSKLHNK
jgi:hypothetical protein